MKNTNDKLNVIGTQPTKSEQAEQMYSIYNQLVAIYANLKQIKLPLQAPKNKWSWTTEMIDYSSQKEAARNFAYNLLMKEGRDYVKAFDVVNAENRLMNAINNYTPDAEQQKSIRRIVAGELCEAAATLMKSQNIDQVINANSFYKSALRFSSDYQLATTGVKESAQYISTLYVNQGKQIEKSTEIDKVITAVDSYKNALKWDSQNAGAQLALKTVVERIAEFYYQAGLKAEKAKANTEAIAMYEKVRTWIPDYKDSMSRIYNIRIGGKLELLAKNVTDNRTTFNKFNTRVQTVSKVVDSSDDVMNKVTYVSDKSRSINQTMKSTSATLKAFSIIPVVGTTTNILAKSIDIAQDPIGITANKFDAIEKPVITPTKTVVGKTKSVVDNLKSKMNTTDVSLKTTADYSLRLKDCISKMTEEVKFQEAEKAIDEINKGLVSSNTVMQKMDKNLSSAEAETKKIANISGTISKVSNGFESVSKAVSKVEPVVNELNGVLDKSFSVAGYSFSARKILNGVSGPMKWIMDKLSDLVMSALKPVLKKFDINIPSVPGLSDLNASLDKLKGNYDVLNAQVDEFAKSATEFVDYQKVIDTNLAKLEKSVGCEIAPKAQ